MTGYTLRAARLLAGLWFGSVAFFLAVAAPAAFSAAPNATAAADIVGAMLTRWHYFALLAPLVLLALQWRRPRGWVVVVLFLAIVFASAEAIIDTRVRALRLASIVPISQLSREHPLRRRFGLLHGLSSLLLLAQVVAGGMIVASVETEG